MEAFSCIGSLSKASIVIEDFLRSDLRSCTEKRCISSTRSWIVARLNIEAFSWIELRCMISERSWSDAFSKRKAMPIRLVLCMIADFSCIVARCIRSALSWSDAFRMILDFSWIENLSIREAFSWIENLPMMEAFSCIGSLSKASIVSECLSRMEVRAYGPSSLKTFIFPWMVARLKIAAFSWKVALSRIEARSAIEARLNIVALCCSEDRCMMSSLSWIDVRLKIAAF